MLLSAFVAASALLSTATAQLSGSVGPTTSTAAKRAKKVCDVTKYGAKADKSTDIGAAITKAFADCKSGGIIYIPPGDYAQSTWVALNGGSGFGIQIDGIIYRTGTQGGNMIDIKGSNDVEVFSSTGKGAIQGYGYQNHDSEARMLRFDSVKDFSVHDFKMVDPPWYFLVTASVTNGEIYNLLLRGANQGTTDGVDIWGTNVWAHDIMVTNKDECVTIKSPSSNILVEQIYCNISGGCAFGSLSDGTAISNVHYRNIYTYQSNQMLMIKSSGGSGYVENVLLENFIGHSNAYSLDIDQYWSKQTTGSGSGVALSNITFKGWRGTAANGVQRAPIKVACADGAPCTGISIQDFAMWTDSGSSIQYTCRSGYGSGACLKSGSGGSYAQVTQTVSSAPNGYSAAKLPDDLSSNFGTTAEIPIPSTWPSNFYPGLSPIKALASG